MIRRRKVMRSARGLWGQSHHIWEKRAPWSSEASFGASLEATTDAPEFHKPSDPTYTPAEKASASRSTRRTLPPARAWQSLSDQPRLRSSVNSAG